MKIGYIRVSTEEQNTARQEVLLRELGVDEVFIDKASGKNADRPELTRMMEYIRRGDTVIVESISRFARNTRDLLDLVERLIEKQVEFVSHKDAIDTTTPTGKFMLTVFAAVAELEREYLAAPVRGHRDCQDEVQVHRPQANAPAGQLRAGGRSLACRRNHRRGSHAADRAQAKYFLPPVLANLSCVPTRGIYIM